MKFETLPRQAEARARLIGATLVFVRAASRLPGVERIALLGSLTTRKYEPKDTDLLVTVAADLDLTELATLGRKLKGHLQSRGPNLGADIFLASPAGEYLGRTCGWRDCRPWLRVRCQALQCGERHYLYDDLQVLRLRPELIAYPPVVLWPRMQSYTHLPIDIQRDLLEPLVREGVSSREENR